MYFNQNYVRGSTYSDAQVAGTVAHEMQHYLGNDATDLDPGVAYNMSALCSH